MLRKFFILFILPLTIGIFFQQDAQSRREKQAKRIYIQKLTIKGDAATVAGDFHNSLIVHFLEQGRGKYRIISDEDIQVMYKQAAKLQAPSSRLQAVMRRAASGRLPMA